MNRIALFPHAEHILPSGRVELTIAEQQHLKMVKMALTSSQKFAMAMIENNVPLEEITRVPALVTQVKIIDFNRLEADLLGITVEGVKLIKVDSIDVDTDRLFWANYQPHGSWSSKKMSHKHYELAEKLKLFYASIPEIGALYSPPHYDDITWVCLRWIEILPIDIKHKQMLLQQKTPHLAIRFLLKLLKDKQTYQPT